MFKHELSCKENPHNHSLCSSCKHCIKKEHRSEKYVRCHNCRRRYIEFDDYNRPIYTQKCDLSEKGACDGSQKYIDFICSIDGCKMYSNKIHRLSSVKAQLIKERCDRPMPTVLEGCVNYDYNE